LGADPAGTCSSPGTATTNCAVGQTCVLKTSTSQSPGNYGAVDLDYATNGSGNCVSGAKQYTLDIATGSPTLHFTGDWICTETGNLVGPTTGTQYGLSGLLSNCQQATKTSCSEIAVTVPIVNDMMPNGKSQVQIIGFGLFYISATMIENLSSNSNQVTGVLQQEFFPPATAWPEAPPWSTTLGSLSGG
jgi:hypothetical protein